MKDIQIQEYYLRISRLGGLDAFQGEARHFMIAAILLILFSTILIVILYARRWYLLAREKKQKELKFRFQYFIYDALVESSKQEVLSSTDLILNRFKRHELESSMEKQLMIDLIIELKKSFGGNSKKQFKHLYLCLGLHHASIAKLSSRDSSQKIKGIHELAEIGHHCPELENAFEAWQISSNTLLADEVKLAAIKSYSAHMFSFLPHQKEPLSAWLQIQLQHHLEALPKEKVPSFFKWLNLQEISSTKFVLQMIALFKQEEAIEHITPLLHHAPDEIKIEAIKTLESLGAKHLASTLFNLLDTDYERLKIASIHAIGTLGHTFHANLLKPLLHQQSSQVRLAAEQAINRIYARASSGLSLVKSDPYSM